MIRSELKKTAQAHLHGKYGNWSSIILIPCAMLFIYFFVTLFLFGRIDNTDSYTSWQDEYSQNDSLGTYQDGYNDGYSDGFEDAYYEEDSKESHKKSKNLSNLSVVSPTSLDNRTRTVTYEQKSEIRFSGFLSFLFFVFALVVVILYQGMIRWTAVENVEGGSFNFKTIFVDFIKNNGKRVIPANLLVALYTFLWSLLFFIPGIVKQLSYSMTNYLLKKDPNLSASEAIVLSRQLMHGYKLEYLIFCYSFFFWEIASFFSFGLVNLYVIPYASVSEVLFFEQIIAEKHHLFSQEKEAGFADF